MIDREELAWAAGLFDGEGSTGSYKIVSGRNCELGITQHHPEVLNRFKEAVGVGSVTGPNKTRDSLVWFYRAYGFEKVQAVVAMLWPFLSTVKREQAVSALKSYKTWKQEQPLLLPSNKSGYKGVHFSRNRWVAELSLGGRKKYLGHFRTAREAATAYDKAAIYHLGAKAKTNARMGLL